MDKVKIPKNLAEAIEKLIKNGCSNLAIVGNVFRNDASKERREIQLFCIENYRINGDILLNALINGYDIE